jgi:hypothetical protein
LTKDPPLQTTFAITHIPSRATPLEVQNTLSQYGSVSKVEFLKKGTTFTGKAIVESPTEEDAQKLQHVIDSRPIKVRSRKVYLYNKL